MDILVVLYTTSLYGRLLKEAGPPKPFSQKKRVPSRRQTTTYTFSKNECLRPRRSTAVGIWSHRHSASFARARVLCCSARSLSFARRRLASLALEPTCLRSALASSSLLRVSLRRLASASRRSRLCCFSSSFWLSSLFCVHFVFDFCWGFGVVLVSFLSGYGMRSVRVREEL